MATPSMSEGPKAACKDAALQLGMCMQEHSACMREGGALLDCLRQGDLGVCEVQRRGYFECRRSQLDMRTRIRGKKFADTG